MVGFIFGGNTGQSAESLRRQRQIAEQLQARAVAGMPQNVGEGLSAIGMALSGKIKEKRADKRLAEGERSASEAFDAIVASLGGGMAPGALARSDRVGTPFVPPVSDARAAPAPFDPAAIEAGLSDDLVSRVIRQESGGNPDAVSPKGATGLMQIMPATARDPGFGVPDIFTLAQQMGRPVQGNDDAALQALLRDPDVNKAFGTQYLAAMLNRSGGDKAKALASYNAGPGAVDQYGGVPPFAETQNYVQAIMGDQPQTDAPMQMVPPQQPQQMGGMTSGSGGIDPRLLQLAGNDFLSDGQRSVVQALLQQQLGGNSGAMTEYQRAMIDLQRQRLEQEGTNAGRGEFGLSPVWGTDAEGNPALIQLGRDGQPVQPQLPEGFNIARDPIRIDAGTKTILLDPQTRQVIGEVAKDVAGEAAAREAGSAEGQRIGSAPKAVTQADMILSDIDAVMNDPQLGNALGWNSYIPLDVPGYNTEPRSRVEKLQGQAFLQAFESLKGGGAITEIEGKKAEQAIARLRTTQTEAEFRTALEELRQIVIAARGRAAARLPSGSPENGGSQPVTPSAPRVLTYNPETGELE